jgi:hypothetical protein
VSRAGPVAKNNEPGQMALHVHLGLGLAIVVVSLHLLRPSLKYSPSCCNHTVEGLRCASSYQIVFNMHR